MFYDSEYSVNFNTLRNTYYQLHHLMLADVNELSHKITFSKLLRPSHEF